MALLLLKTDPKDFRGAGGGEGKRARPLCRVECEGDVREIYTSNLLDLERDPDTPLQVREFVSGIWDALALPGCSIDADLLRRVMDFGSSGGEGSGDFWDRTFDIREQGNKIAKQAGKWVATVGAEVPSPVAGTGDLLGKFFRSKLGVLLLRGMLNLSSVWTDPLKTGKLPRLLLDSMDRQFTSSPVCCLYVRDLEVEILPPSAGKSSMRSSLKTRREVPGLMEQFAVSVPSREQLEKAAGDAFLVYSQLSAGYVGCIGDFYSGSDVFEARKRSIEDKWKAAMTREHHAGQGPSRSKYKWFDNFAGTDDLSKAATRMVLTDCPPVSLWATLSNVKRNLVCLAYLCKVFEASCRDKRSCQYSGSTTEEEILVEMAEFVCSFFTEDGSLALTHNFPLRMSKQSRTPYLTVKDYIVKTVGGMGSMRFLKKVNDLGLTDQGLTKFLTKLENSTCVHVPFYNGLSMSEMDHSERELLTETGHEDHKSLVLVPIRLSSYEMNSCTKFSSGIKTHYQKGCPGVIAGKASILFQRNESTAGFPLSAEDHTKELAVSFRIMLDEGMTQDEATSAMSLSPQQKEKVVQFLEEEEEQEDQPSAKRLKK